MIYDLIKYNIDEKGSILWNLRVQISGDRNEAVRAREMFAGMSASVPEKIYATHMNKKPVLTGLLFNQKRCIQR